MVAAVAEEGIGFHTRAAGAGIDCHVVVAGEDRLEANTRLLELPEEVPDHSRLDHHMKAAGYQAGMERLMADTGDHHLLQTGKAG